MVEESRTILECYHGTDESNVDDILENGFNFSHNPVNFLGFGVYFYEGSYSSAMYWAKKDHKKRPNPVVLQTMVKLRVCLNMAENANIKEFRAFYYDVTKKLSQAQKEKVGSLEMNVIIDLFVEKYKIHTVKFNKLRGGKPNFFLGNKNGFVENNDTYICVKDLSVISDTRRYL